MNISEPAGGIQNIPEMKIGGAYRFGPEYEPVCVQQPVIPN
jgi:hypothetical protein